jgi:hypothetical protein
MKPLFIIMKNEGFMEWLKKHRIFIEENDLETMLPTSAGLVFFAHPHPSLIETYHEHFRSMFIGQEVPTFKVRRFRVKSGKHNAMVLLIQTVQDKELEVCRRVEEVKEKNNYEFIPWKSWLSSHPSNKVITIKKHNT